MRGLRSLLVGSLALLIARTAPGQMAPASLTIHLHVAGDTTPIAQVQVWLAGSPKSERSDATGTVRFASLAPGSYTVRARRLGYDAADTAVTLQPGQHIEWSWALRPRAPMLSEVVVNGHVVPASPFFTEPLRRARLGFGRFVYADDIQRRGPMYTADILDAIPGVRIKDAVVNEFDEPVHRRVYFERCFGEAAQHVQVWVNGTRLTAFMPPEVALEQVSPSEIEIMEVYSGPSSIPADFLVDACAVIVIWTKRS